MKHLSVITVVYKGDMEDHEESRQLVASILAGDTDLFQAIIEQHQKLVAHIVFRMVENRSEGGARFTIVLPRLEPC